MSGDLELLADYWSMLFAVRADESEQPLPPLCVVTGAEADAVASWLGDGSDVPSLAHLMGMLVYPCDAIHVVGCFASMAVIIAEDDDVPEGVGADDPRSQLAITCWAHTIPTSETEVRVVVRHIADDGSTAFDILDEHDIDHDAADAVDPFLMLRAAAHDYDSYSIPEGEADNRRLALQIIENANDEGHFHAEFLEPGAVLTWLREEERP